MDAKYMERDKTGLLTMKKKRIRSYLNDYSALESDVLLTAIQFERDEPSKAKLSALQERINYLKRKLLGK